MKLIERNTFYIHSNRQQRGQVRSRQVESRVHGSYRSNKNAPRPRAVSTS
jgi:hypothetical protein